MNPDHGAANMAVHTKVQALTYLGYVFPCHSRMQGIKHFSSGVSNQQLSQVPACAGSRIALSSSAAPSKTSSFLCRMPPPLLQYRAPLLLCRLPAQCIRTLYHPLIPATAGMN